MKYVQWVELHTSNNATDLLESSVGELENVDDADQASVLVDDGKV